MSSLTSFQELQRVMAFADLPTFRCHYGLTGPAHGPPVLLIMGFGMPGIAWQPLVSRLSPHCRVCWYDHPGVGGSTDHRQPYTMAELAHDATLLMDHLKWPEAHVVGISMGGMVAQHVGLHHPSRVASLTLIATSPGPVHRYLPPARGLSQFATVNLHRGERRLRALVDLLYPPQRRPSSLDEVPEGLRVALAHPAAGRTRRRQLRAILAHRTRPHLHRLPPVSTTIVSPSLDLLIPPRASQDLHRAISHSRILTLPDAGHGVIAQEPEEVAFAILTQAIS